MSHKQGMRLAPQKSPVNRQATVADWLAIPENERYHELLNGRLVRKTAPAFNHGGCQRLLGAMLDAYHRPARKGRRGGWYLATEPDLLLASKQIVRPDLAGWRRENLPADLDRYAALCQVRPDWVCEVVSPKNTRRDTVTKRHIYERAGVPFYWIVDPKHHMLTVLGLDGRKYANIMITGGTEPVRAAPFADMALRLARLFSDDN